MTRKEIEQMPAGREMDALVVEAIGWLYHPSSCEQIEPGLWKRDGAVLWKGSFAPSTDIADAWAVVGFFEDVTVIREEFQYSVGIVTRSYDQAWANAKQAPLAICRAVLLASLDE